MSYVVSNHVKNPIAQIIPGVSYGEQCLIDFFVVAGGKCLLQQNKLGFVVLCESVLFFDTIDGMFSGVS